MTDTFEERLAKVQLELPKKAVVDDLIGRAKKEINELDQRIASLTYERETMALKLNQLEQLREIL